MWQYPRMLKSVFLLSFLIISLDAAAAGLGFNPFDKGSPTSAGGAQSPRPVSPNAAPAAPKSTPAPPPQAKPDPTSSKSAQSSQSVKK